MKFLFSIIFFSFFYVVYSQSCESIPALVFKANSTICDTMYEAGKDSADFLPANIIKANASLLQKNPRLMVEVSGYCSADEHRPEKLSLERAEKVKFLLMKYGIDGKRIQTKGLGTERPKVSTKEIEKEKTGRELLIRKNRRVVFKGLAKPYAGK